MPDFPEVKLNYSPTPEQRFALREYVDWIDAGAPARQPFSRVLGICGNITDYSSVKQWSYDLFEDEVPFLEYEPKEINSSHLNPARIAWARANAVPKETGNDQLTSTTPPNSPGNLAPQQLPRPHSHA